MSNIEYYDIQYAAERTITCIETQGGLRKSLRATDLNYWYNIVERV